MTFTLGASMGTYEGLKGFGVLSACAAPGSRLLVLRVLVCAGGDDLALS